MSTPLRWNLSKFIVLIKIFWVKIFALKRRSSPSAHFFEQVVNMRHTFGNFILTRRLQRRSLRLPTRSKSAQTGHMCTTAQAGADPGIFVCSSKFPGLKVGRRS